MPATARWKGHDDDVPHSDIVRHAAALDWIDLKQLVAFTGQAESSFDLAIVKELIDNAIDAAEKAKEAPRVTVLVARQDDVWNVVVADSGHGLDADTVERVLDFEARTSSKDWRRAPTRGQQGNALKTVAGIAAAQARRRDPHAQELPALEVLGPDGVLDVGLVPVAGALRVNVRKKPVATGPLTLLNGLAQSGAFFPKAAIGCRLTNVTPESLRALVRRFPLVNPHMSLNLEVDDRREQYEPRSSAPWRPSDKSAIGWYTDDDFAKLCDAARQLAKPVTWIIGQLAGFSAKAMTADVMSAAGILARAKASDMNAAAQRALLAALAERAEPGGADMLRRAGKEALRGGAGGRYTSVSGAFRFGRATVPFVVEAALVPGHGEVACAINYSPTFVPPIVDHLQHGDAHGLGLAGLAMGLHIDRAGGVDLRLHVVCPRLAFRDRGKAQIDAPAELAEAVARAVCEVAEKHHRVEKRRRRANAPRRAPARADRESILDACDELLPVAYHAARGSFSFALARQVFYKLRPLLLGRLGDDRNVSDKYITQTVIPRYLRNHPASADWTILYDARGKLWEPHSGVEVPLGMSELEEYLLKPRRQPTSTAAPAFDAGVNGPGERYQAVLFIEKEGFIPLLKSSGILEEHDLAVMTTKGMSTTAARRFFEQIAGTVRIFALHDFDVSGMNIVATLYQDTARYQFEKPIKVVDLGLRLADVQEHRLASEYQAQKIEERKLRKRLRRHGATPEEVNFLASGQRVELNAFGNDEFLEWLRAGLRAHGVEKVIPDDERIAQTFEAAQRHAVFCKLLESVRRQANAAVMPPRAVEEIREFVRARFDADPRTAWDEAIAAFASETIRGES